MTNIISLIFFLIFFVGTNVLSVLGIDTFVFFYIIISISIVSLMLNPQRISFKDRKYELGLLILIILTLLYRLSNGMLNDSLRSAAILFAPPLIYLLIPKDIKTKKEFQIKKKIIRLVVAFYVIECLLAISEYIFRTHVFLWVDTTFESHLTKFASNESFRSVAIHGAPLTNALVVTTLNAFFITSSLKDKYKFVLWGIGFLAVMAFNARMATLINLVFLVFYLLKLLSSRRTVITTKLLVYVSALSFAGVVYFLIIRTGLGDRLFKSDLLDENSAQTRIDLFSIFEGFSWSDFLFGKSMREFDYMREAAGLLIVENFWVSEIILFGILFVALLVFIYMKLLNSYGKQYSLDNRIVITFSFILLASTNNSLFTQYIPLLLFLVCWNLFRPDTLGAILPKKYVNYSFK